MSMSFHPYEPKPLARYAGPFKIVFPSGLIKRRFTWSDAIDEACGHDAKVFDKHGTLVLQDTTAAYAVTKDYLL